jgi:hypothetical protein
VTRVAVIAVLLVALAAGCGGGDEASETAPTTTQAPAATTTEAPPATTETEPATTTAPAKPKPEVVDVEVVGGQPKGGIVRATVDQGSRVVINITADAADEAHLHGYDLEAELEPGSTAKISFVAKTPGRFELELHHAGTQIGELTVQP